MKALCWYGKHDVRVENVADPDVLNPHDIILRVTSTAICGSDLHMFDGFIPGMKPGDVLGHEFMGEVVEIGADVKHIRKYDRVVVPFAISCGSCWYCTHDLWSLCDNTNPNAAVVEKVYEHSPAGMFGYSHLFGGYAGGQAEFVRVPFGNVGALKVPEGLSDEEALFLSDIFPTGYQAVEQCGLRGGETVAVWGCGPVGQFAIRSAFMLGAERVIAIDRYPARLKMAQDAGAEPLNFELLDVLETLRELTAGRGPDACIDAVGMEAHGTSVMAVVDYAKQAVRLESDRPHVLRQAIVACRKGGTVSIPGVYGGFIDKVPIGAAFNKGLTLRMGQTHVRRYMRPLLDRIERGEIDPRFVVTHRLKLDDAARGYELFSTDKDACVKAVLKA